MTSLTITCIAIAAVIVIANMLLQHQKDIDRLHGYAQEDKAYTIGGTWKAMRAVRKAEKRRAKEELARRSTAKREESIRIKDFSE